LGGETVVVLVLSRSMEEVFSKSQGVAERRIKEYGDDVL
jgi:hypothetical protein